MLEVEVAWMEVNRKKLGGRRRASAVKAKRTGDRSRRRVKGSGG